MDVSVRRLRVNCSSRSADTLGEMRNAVQIDPRRLCVDDLFVLKIGDNDGIPSAFQVLEEEEVWVNLPNRKTPDYGSTTLPVKREKRLTFACLTSQWRGYLFPRTGEVFYCDWNGATMLLRSRFTLGQRDKIYLLIPEATPVLSTPNPTPV